MASDTLDAIARFSTVFTLQRTVVVLFHGFPFRAFADDVPRNLAASSVLHGEDVSRDTHISHVVSAETGSRIVSRIDKRTQTFSRDAPRFFV